MSSNSTSPSIILAGGIPNNADKVLSIIYIIAFVVAGLLLHLKTRRLYGNMFIWSRIGVSFSMARIVALVFRILVVDNPANKTDNIVEQVMISSGITILYVINAQMSRRFFGQLHPQSGIVARNTVLGILLLIIPVIAIIIVSVVQLLNTTNAHTLSVDHTLRKIGSACMIVFVALPIPIILLGFILRNSAANTRTPQSYTSSSQTTPAYYPGLEVGQQGYPATSQMDMDVNMKMNYGEPPRVPGEPATGFGYTPRTSGGIMTNAAFILIPAILLTIQASIKLAQATYSPEIGVNSPWYMSKATLWIFGFTFDLLSIFILGLAVLPRRFSYLKPI